MGQAARQTARAAVPPRLWRDRGETARAGGRRRQWIAGVGIAMLAAAIAGYLAYRAAADLPGVKFADQGNLHIEVPGQAHEPYNSEPPTSGPHLPYLAPWGVHTEPIPRELQVHNLEDGGVVVQYHCPAGCPELVAQLTAIVQQYPTQMVLAPYPGMKHRIALTAWTRLDAFDEFDEGRIQRFIRAHRGVDHHK
jgi:Protein of unknown function (DUF3105)